MKININNKIYFKSIYPDFDINNENLSIFFINHLKKKENKVILVDENLNKMKSYEFINNIEKVAKGFQSFVNLKKGDKVGIILPNIMEFTYCVLGVILSGGVVSQINSNSIKEDIKNTLSTLFPKYLIINHSNYFRIKEYLIELFPKCEKLIIVPDSDNYEPYLNAPIEIFNLNKLMNNDGVYDNQNSIVDPSQDTALILFSGGISGKGVCLTHSNLISSVHQMIANEYSHHKESQIILNCLPLYNIYSFITPFLTGLTFGSCIYFIKNYSLSKVLEIISREKITLAFIIPSIGIDLAKSQEVLKYDCSSLKTLISGGAVFPNDISNILQKRFGYSINNETNSINYNLKVRQGYVFTEGCNLSHSNPNSIVKSGSCGFIVPNMIVKVIDIANGNNLDSNQTGELCFKGPNIMKEYYNNHIATREAFDNEGFFLSGDIGYIDNDGEIFIIDRKIDLIKSNGIHISPNEIESLLLSHPKINEVCVIGVNSEEYGEEAKAFIVLKDNDITKKDVHKWLNLKLSNYKSLGGGIVFVDKLPKSSSGKVIRRILKTQSKL